jgi:hypothetical protein
MKLTAIVWMRNIHLQPILSATNPPIVGPFLVSISPDGQCSQADIPTMGPSSTPREYIAVALPRSLATIRSEMDPAPTVRGVDPAQPARNLNANSIPRLFASPQRIVNMTNRTLLIWYIILLP